MPFFLRLKTANGDEQTQFCYKTMVFSTIVHSTFYELVYRTLNREILYEIAISASPRRISAQLSSYLHMVINYVKQLFAEKILEPLTDCYDVDFTELLDCFEFRHCQQRQRPLTHVTDYSGMDTSELGFIVLTRLLAVTAQHESDSLIAPRLIRSTLHEMYILLPIGPSIDTTADQPVLDQITIKLIVVSSLSEIEVMPASTFVTMPLMQQKLSSSFFKRMQRWFDALPDELAAEILDDRTEGTDLSPALLNGQLILSSTRIVPIVQRFVVYSIFSL